MKKKNRNSWLKQAAFCLGAVAMGVFALQVSSSISKAESVTYEEVPEDKISVEDYLIEKWKRRVVEIDLTGRKVTPTDLTAISYQAENRYPELYYMASREYYTDSEGYITRLTMVYSADRDAELKAEAEKVAALVNDSMSDLEKALVVHDYLCLDIEYGGIMNIRNILGPILNKEAVCEGYARAYKYYMDYIGVPCKVVGGYAYTSAGDAGHAWNQVEIDGKWYLVDPTWDDVGGSGSNGNNVKYEYFMRSADYFHSKGYEWTESLYETCNDTKYDDAFWTKYSSKYSMYADNGSLCYIKSGGFASEIYKHDLNNDKLQDEGRKIVSIGETWKLYENTSGYGYASFAYKDGLLYYSTPKAVYSCDFNGENEKMVLSLEGEQQIWDIKILGGTLYYQTAAGLYDTRTTQSMVLDADYQKAKYPISIQSHSVTLSYGEEHLLNSYAPGTITYTSNHPEICAVDSYGVLKPAACGTADITLRTEETALYLPGEEVIQVEIVPKDISDGNVVLSDYQVTYNGKPHTPAVTVNRVKGLTEDDYTVTYKNNVNPGTATVTVTGTGERYTGTLTASFTIEKGSGTVIEPDTEVPEPDTEAPEPETKEPETETEPETKEPETETEPETKEPETETEPETREPETETESETKEPETETESETKEPETETESETKEPETETEPETREPEAETKEPDKGVPQLETKAPQTELPGSSEAEPPSSSVSVKKPVKVKLSSAKPFGKKKIKVRWKSQKCSGYRIEVSRKRNFKGLVKAVNVKGQKKKAKVISGLKSKNTYYVRVRAYKKVNGKVYYGAYSKIKRVRTK